MRKNSIWWKSPFWHFRDSRSSWIHWQRAGKLGRVFQPLAAVGSEGCEQRSDRTSNTVVAASTWWAYMEEKTGALRLHVNLRAPGSKLTSEEAGRNSRQVGSRVKCLPKGKPEQKARRQRFTLKCKVLESLSQWKVGFEDKIKCNDCKIVSLLHTQVGNSKSF